MFWGVLGDRGRPRHAAITHGAGIGLRYLKGHSSYVEA